MSRWGDRNNKSLLKRYGNEQAPALPRDIALQLWEYIEELETAGPDMRTWKQAFNDAVAKIEEQEARLRRWEAKDD
jgi:hypothetical protein